MIDMIYLRMTQSNQGLAVLDFLEGYMYTITKGSDDAIQLATGHLGAGQELRSVFQGYETQVKPGGGAEARATFNSG